MSLFSSYLEKLASFDLLLKEDECEAVKNLESQSTASIFPHFSDASTARSECMELPNARKNSQYVMGLSVCF